MKALTFLTWFSLLALPGCSLLPGTGDDSWPVINREYLTQHWVHAYEEEASGSTLEVYRPRDYKEFPPSRFRMQYVLEQGGECQWYYLAPDDGHHFRSGAWQLEEDNVLRIERGEETVRYRILELTQELLQMKRLGADEH